MKEEQKVSPDQGVVHFGDGRFRQRLAPIENHYFNIEEMALDNPTISM
jgi:hypothetical protein